MMNLKFLLIILRKASFAALNASGGEGGGGCRWTLLKNQ